VGDVGIIADDGGFDFMFNICLPRGHPINPDDLPDDFVPLDPPLRPTDIRGHREFKKNHHLASTSVSLRGDCHSYVYYSDLLPVMNLSRSLIHRSGLSFQTSAEAGAVVTMPQGAYSEKLGNVPRFKKYISAHAESWYKYVNGACGREAKNGDVRLVIGTDKASTWGMAAFSNLIEESEFQLRFKAIEKSSLGYTYGWEYSGMAEVRAGPDPEEVEDLRMNQESERGVVYENQCLFMKTLNVTVADDVWNNLSLEPESEQEAVRTPSSSSTARAGGPLSSTSQPSSGNLGPTRAKPSVQSEEVKVSLVCMVYFDSCSIS